MLGLICIALLQPSFTMSRYRTQTPRIALLLDRSQSMGQFPQDTLLRNTVCRLCLARGAPYAHRIPVFGFGSALRSIDDCGAVRFQDSTSVFPPVFSPAELAHASHVVLLTDGHFDNALLPEERFANTTYRYVTMRDARPRPFARVSVLSCPDEVREDSAWHMRVSVSGYARGQVPMHLHCIRKTTTVASRPIEADTGFFHDTLLVRVPGGSAGRVLYTVTLGSSDSVYAADKCVQQIVPDGLTVCIDTTRPGLDHRFFTLCMSRLDIWNTRRGMGTDPAHCDARVLFASSRSSAVAADISRVPSGVPVVVFGTIPGASALHTVTNTYRLRASPLSTAQDRRLDAALLSPSVSLLQGDMSALADIRVYLAAHTRQDTRIPVVFTARYRGRPVLVVAARQTWRWDFSPVSPVHSFQSASADRNTELVQSGAQPFSAYIASVLRQLTLTQVFDTHVAFVRQSRPTTRDSIYVRLFYPASFSRSSVRGTRTLTVLDSMMDTVYHDTASVQGGVQHHRVALPPRTAGSYRYISTVRDAYGSYTYSDSFHVYRPRTEQQVFRQNTVLLDRYADALPPERVAAYIDSIHALGRIETGIPVTRRIALQRTWWMLGIALALLAAEWVLRRRWRME
jgi:hypothetical protein